MSGLNVLAVLTMSERPNENSVDSLSLFLNKT